MNEPHVDEGLLRPLDAANNTIVAPRPQPPSRSTDIGDDYDKGPPRRSSMSTPDDKMAINKPRSQMAVTKAPRAERPQVAPPPQKNRRKKGEEGGSLKMLKSRGHSLYHRDPTNSESPPLKPGAVFVEAMTSRSGRSSTPQTTTGFNRDSVVTDPGTPFEPQIVASLIPDVDDQQVVEARIARQADERFSRQMEEGEIILAAEVNDSSTCCGLKKRTLLLLGILALVMIIGGIVGGVRASTSGDRGMPLPAPTLAPTTLDDAILEELMSLNATFEQYLWQFEAPKSPQYKALAWMKNDTIVMSSGRSTKDLLQRYVLAVLFYATNGPNWVWSQPYLSSDDVCSWNKGSEDYGVYCRLDGESVDELKLSANSIERGGNELPWELGLLSTLTIVQLDSNQFTGTIPVELGQLLSLTSLGLDSNQLTGTIPTELGQLLSLESLDLDSNQLTGTIPTELWQLLSLTSLGIFVNQLTGTIPTELGQLLSLTDVYIDYTQLTGTIPTEIGQLLSLTSLYITTMHVAGTIPTELGLLTSLEVINIGSSFTGTIPTELGQLLSLRSLDVESNLLSGTIPTELGQLLSLESLALIRDRLTGTIPTELGQLLSLQYLGLINKLTGTIPSELGQLLSLTSLDFQNNLLSGTLPTELGQLLSLESISMYQDMLTGTMPTELGQLLSLTSLVLGSNKLTGTIPSEIAGIRSLTTVSVSKNALTGSLEQSFCAANRTWSSLVVDCDEVECSCCYSCV